MKDIPLASLPNQNFTVAINSRLYELTFKAGKAMSVSIKRDNEMIVSGLRVVSGGLMLPAKYKEEGNFVLTTDNDDLPEWEKFGSTQFLTFLEPSELEAFRA